MYYFFLIAYRPVEEYFTHIGTSTLSVRNSSPCWAAIGRDLSRAATWVYSPLTKAGATEELFQIRFSRETMFHLKI